MNPVLSYRFYVRLLNGPKNTIIRAQSISGLGVSMQLKEIETTAGIRKIPANVEYSNLVLKRAILEKAGNVGLSTVDLLNKLQVKRMDMGLHLLDTTGKYCRSWNVIGAYAIKWNISEVSANSNEVLMETLEFEYKYLKEIR